MKPILIIILLLIIGTSLAYITGFWYAFTIALMGAALIVARVLDKK